MKKKYLPAIFPLALFLACNNKEEKEPGTAPVAVNMEQVLKDSVSKYPDSLLLRENLIQYYRENGSYDGALAATNEALKKDSLNARLWKIRGTLYFENDDTLNAIRSFERAVGIMPDPKDLKSLGTLYVQTKNNKALALADQLIKDKYPDAAKDALFIKGQYFLYTGDKEQAIAFFDKCLALDYNFMYAYREKAVALYELGRYEEAVKLLDRAVTLQNRFDEGYFWKGRCLEKLNKPAEAAEEYRKALLYSPDFLEAKEALARLERK